MKTIVSLALAGLMSISALLPALAAQEAESVSIPESSSISESVAQDESSICSAPEIPNHTERNICCHGSQPDAFCRYRAIRQTLYPGTACTAAGRIP